MGNLELGQGPAAFAALFGGEEGAVFGEEVFGPADFELPGVEQGFILGDEGVVLLPDVLADLRYGRAAAVGAEGGNDPGFEVGAGEHICAMCYINNI